MLLWLIFFLLHLLANIYKNLSATKFKLKIHEHGFSQNVNNAFFSSFVDIFNG